MDLSTARPVGPPLPGDGPVFAAGFSPDGQTLATLDGERTVRLWRVVQPVAGDLQRVVAWAQVYTTLELDGDGMVRQLGGEVLQQRRQRLQELGGSP